jgi:hypothetical protein
MMTTHRPSGQLGPSVQSATALTALTAHPDEAARCQHCGEPIAATRRIDARYCDASCRSADRHARTALNTTASVRARERQAAEEHRQRRAWASLEGGVIAYVPPPERAWIAASYASRRRARGAGA